MRWWITLTTGMTVSSGSGTTHGSSSRPTDFWWNPVGGRHRRCPRKFPSSQAIPPTPPPARTSALPLGPGSRLRGTVMVDLLCGSSRPTTADTVTRAAVAEDSGSKRRFSTGATEGAIAAFKSAAFALGPPAPHSGALAGLDGPFQAGLSDFASTADCLGLLGLKKRRGSVPVGEEQLGVLPPGRRHGHARSSRWVPSRSGLEDLGHVGGIGLAPRRSRVPLYVV